MPLKGFKLWSEESDIALTNVTIEPFETKFNALVKTIDYVIIDDVVCFVLQLASMRSSLRLRRCRMTVVFIFVNMFFVLRMNVNEKLNCFCSVFFNCLF